MSIVSTTDPKAAPKPSYPFGWPYSPYYYGYSLSPYYAYGNINTFWNIEALFTKKTLFPRLWIPILAISLQKDVSEVFAQILLNNLN